MDLRMTGLTNNYLFQYQMLNRGYDISKTSEQLATEKKINRPSDDPAGAQLSLSYKQTLDQYKSYSSNLDVADRQLKQSETALTSVEEILRRAKELTIQGNNGVLNAQARTAIADEVQQLQQHLKMLGNSEINGQYIFSGYQTTTAPFTLAPAQPAANPVVTYNGDSNLQSVQIGESSNLTIQSRGDLVFTGDSSNPATVNLFQTLANLEVALRANNVNPASPSRIETYLPALDNGLNQVIAEVTSIGANQKRVESTKDYLGAQTDTLEGYVNSIENVDLTEAALNSQRASSAMQATIEAAGNILKLPSLMDFLKG